MEFNAGKIRGIVIAVLCFGVLMWLLFRPSTDPPRKRLSAANIDQIDTTKVIKPKLERIPLSKLSNRPSKRVSSASLADGEQRLYDSLEASTRRYLLNVIGPTLLEKYQFDPDNKIKTSISAYFELSEEAIIDGFKNRIINTVMLDTIRDDTLDLRFIVYK